MLLRDRGFLRRFFSLYWAIVLQNVVVLSVNLVDNVMLGRYDEFALAGAATVNQVQFILQMVVGGVGAGLMVLGAQYWGEGRAEIVRTLTAQGIWIGFAVGVLFFAVCSVFPRQILGIFTPDARILEQGLRYLSVMRWTFAVFSVTLVLQNALQSVDTVRLAFYVALEALLVNVLLNALLIPRWGVRGAAVATLIARVLSLVHILVYMFRFDWKIGLRLRSLLACDRALFRDLVAVSAPVIASNALWGASTAMQTVILGHMSVGSAAASGSAVASGSAIAANSMAGTLYSILKTASQGAASVATILMGNAVVAGNLSTIRAYTRTLQVLFLMIGAVASTLLFVLRAPILSLYSMSPETRQMANQFLLVLCVTGFGTAYQMPTITGIIRGGGDTRFCMINDLITIWGVGIPLSLLAAFRFGWPPVAVFACLNADQIVKCAAGAIRCNRYRWVKKRTRDEAVSA